MVPPKLTHMLRFQTTEIPLLGKSVDREDQSPLDMVTGKERDELVIFDCTLWTVCTLVI